MAEKDDKDVHSHDSDVYSDLEQNSIRSDSLEESAHSDATTSSSVSSLLDRLRAPTPSMLARKRKIKLASIIALLKTIIQWSELRLLQAKWVTYKAKWAKLVSKKKKSKIGGKKNKLCQGLAMSIINQNSSSWDLNTTTFPPLANLPIC